MAGIETIDPTALDETIKKMRQEYPDMFSHKNAKPNEVCFAVQVLEMACMNVQLYRQAGLTTARMDDKDDLLPITLSGKSHLIAHRAIFADLIEFATHIYKRHIQEQQKLNAEKTR